MRRGDLPTNLHRLGHEPEDDHVARTDASGTDADWFGHSPCKRGRSRPEPRMNRDYSEMFAALSAARVEFLVVGAYAMAAHGLPRATGDIDIWVHPTPENAARVMRGLRMFGAPLFELSVDDLPAPDTVFQIGVAPSRIDILTGITGVRFADAWPNRMLATIDGETRSVPGNRRPHSQQDGNRKTQGSSRSGLVAAAHDELTRPHNSAMARRVLGLSILLLCGCFSYSTTITLTAAADVPPRLDPEELQQANEAVAKTVAPLGLEPDPRLGTVMHDSRTDEEWTELVVGAVLGGQRRPRRSTACQCGCSRTNERTSTAW